MAIQVSYTDVHGVTHTEAYAKIKHCNLSSEDPVFFIVAIYVNAASSNANKQPLATCDYTLTGSDKETIWGDSVLKDENKTPLSQAYTYLKTVDDSDNFMRLGINWTTGITDV